jgi:hypothetical protein
LPHWNNQTQGGMLCRPRFPFWSFISIIQLSDITGTFP